MGVEQILENVAMLVTLEPAPKPTDTASLEKQQDNLVLRLGQLSLNNIQLGLFAVAIRIRLIMIDTHNHHSPTCYYKFKTRCRAGPVNSQSLVCSSPIMRPCSSRYQSSQLCFSLVSQKASATMLVPSSMAFSMCSNYPLARSSNLRSCRYTSLCILRCVYSTFLRCYMEVCLIQFVPRCSTLASALSRLIRPWRGCWAELVRSGSRGSFYCYVLMLCIIMQLIQSMGSQQASADTHPPSKKYVHDAHYGGSVILSELTHTVFQQFIADQKNLAHFLRLVKTRKQLTHPHLLTIKGSFCKNEKLPTFSCNNQSKTVVFVEYNYISKTLEHHIEEYISMGLQMPQRQIVRIFSSVVQVLRYLQAHNTCHGDIKAGNILFDDLGNAQLVDAYFVNGGKTAYEIVMENPSSMSLLSPEQLERIKNRQLEDMEDIHDHEIYALGLTMIEAMTFEPAMQFYDLQKLSIKKHYAQRKFQELKNANYSPQLIILVMSCIAEKKEARPNFEQFLKTIKIR